MLVMRASRKDKKPKTKRKNERRERRIKTVRIKVKISNRIKERRSRASQGFNIILRQVMICK